MAGTAKGCNEVQRIAGGNEEEPVTLSEEVNVVNLHLLVFIQNPMRHCLQCG